MFKFKINHTLMLIGVLILSMSAAPMTPGKSKEEKAAEFAGKVKAGITRLGVGPDARVEVKLRDRTKLKGYVSQIGDESFVVADAKTGVTTEVQYPDVAKVKGNNLSTGATIAIAVGLAVGATILVLYLIHLAATD
ncbi:MAG: hypothetical protein IPM55_07800 [Acidobacteria bacterium]|nr:hypothetical protein [Acidobacteriota bacterium]